MVYKSDEIVEMGGDLVIQNNLKPGKVYDWIDPIGITQRPDDPTNNLFFATHLDGADGWHNPVDRRPYANQIAQEKGWDLVVEPDFSVEGADSLMVSSLTGLSLKLYEESRKNSNPYIVGVTGSVGKTTTVAFAEHLLLSAGLPVVRFWSKRLTPLLVETHYINRINKSNNGFVVMEYSAYGADHVGSLAEKLPPNIAFLTNLYDNHLNEGVFKDRKDLLDSKRRIKPEKSLGYMNQKVLSELGEPTPSGWNTFNMDMELSGRNPMLPPTYRTAEMHTVGRLLAEELGIQFDVFKKAFDTFQPQERRILSVPYHDDMVFFDGEATGACRLWSWFETLNDIPPKLFVESVDFGEEDMSSQMPLLQKIFDSDSTYVLDTEKNRRRIPVNGNFLDPNSFRERFARSSGEYMVYHKAMSTRNPDFNPAEYIGQNF